MSFYCWKCRKNTKSKNPKVVKTKNGRTILLSKCVVRNSLTGINVPTLSDLAIINTLF